MLSHSRYRRSACRAGASLSPVRPVVRKSVDVTLPKPRLLDRVPAALRARHLSRARFQRNRMFTP